ncbi:hypothetical protein [Thiocystis violacea]|uniref:hypothetical protein n=1 Tax=Thiocystis violacea TaxID=13725 RepID=UPI0019034E7A|nr:hypothetical protein [Thiocystis violacea]MBK1725398.1 hypothetical protein [Thiocystis violacea]
MSQLVNALGPSAMQLPAIFVRTPEAGKRFIEFFTANIRNSHTRRAYTRATVDFASWCDQARASAYNIFQKEPVAAVYRETASGGSHVCQYCRSFRPP